MTTSSSDITFLFSTSRTQWFTYKCALIWLSFRFRNNNKKKIVSFLHFRFVQPFNSFQSEHLYIHQSPANNVEKREHVTFTIEPLQCMWAHTNSYPWWWVKWGVFMRYWRLWHVYYLPFDPFNRNQMDREQNTTDSSNGNVKSFCS